jgi:segregation and condensation protein A
VYNSVSFSLENFEGPLELLLGLVQKNELDICQIAIKELTAQIMQTFENDVSVDASSEILILAATLLHMKSHKLLPGSENTESPEDDPRIEMIQNLIEYCRLKEVAKTLSTREEEQKAFFSRATPSFCKEMGMGLEEVDLSHLKDLLINVLAKAEITPPQQVIKEEELQISDKVIWWRETLKDQRKICFETIFSLGNSRRELIVLFLSLLEVMRLQEVRVVFENGNLYIITP